MSEMQNMKIIVKKGGGGGRIPDAQEIPAWFLDPECVAPCPCGRMPDGPTFIYEGGADMKRWFHKDCVGFLKHELDEEEMERFMEWKRAAEE